MFDWVSKLFAMRPPVIEAAHVSDASQLAQLHGASFHRGWGRTEFEQLLLDRNTLTHRLRQDRHLIGFLVSRLAADEAEILSIAITPHERGHGLSRDLLHTHLGHLAGRGIKKVFLEVEENNQPARRLYERAGFRVVGRRERYYSSAEGEHLNALVMQRDLS
jgi:ribosomal-protein-alanine N-acetyltransferase